MSNLVSLSMGPLSVTLNVAVMRRWAADYRLFWVSFILANSGFLLSNMYVVYLIHSNLIKIQNVTDLLELEKADTSRIFPWYPLLLPVTAFLLFSLSLLTTPIDRNGKLSNPFWYIFALTFALAFAAYQLLSNGYASQMNSNLQIVFFRGFKVFDIVGFAWDGHLSAGAHTVARNIQEFQRQYRCCGWNGPVDYQLTYLPLSCCSAAPFIDFDTWDSLTTCDLAEAIYTGCRHSERFQSIAQMETQFALQVALILLLFILMIAKLVNGSSG